MALFKENNYLVKFTHKKMRKKNKVVSTKTKINA